MKSSYGKWKVVQPEGVRLKHRKGHVAFVRSDDSDELFVLKIPKPESVGVRTYPDGTSEEVVINHVDNFRNEISLAAMMDHPNVIKVVDFDADCEQPWMVTEYYKGGALRYADLDNWTLEEKYSCFRQICLGTQYIHSMGYVRNDGGLNNTFLKEDGRTPVVGDLEACHQLTLEEGAGAMLALAQLFMSIVEGKEFSMMLYQERKLNDKIEKLTKELDQARQQRAELIGSG